MTFPRWKAVATFTNGHPHPLASAAPCSPISCPLRTSRPPPGRVPASISSAAVNSACPCRPFV